LFVWYPDHVELGPVFCGPPLQAATRSYHSPLWAIESDIPRFHAIDRLRDPYRRRGRLYPHWTHGAPTTTNGAQYIGARSSDRASPVTGRAAGRRRGTRRGSGGGGARPSGSCVAADSDFQRLTTEVWAARRKSAHDMRSLPLTGVTCPRPVSHAEAAATRACRRMSRISRASEQAVFLLAVAAEEKGGIHRCGVVEQPVRGDVDDVEGRRLTLTTDSVAAPADVDRGSHSGHRARRSALTLTPPSGISSSEPDRGKGCGTRLRAAAPTNGLASAKQSWRGAGRTLVRPIQRQPQGSNDGALEQCRALDEEKRPSLDRRA